VWDPLAGDYRTRDGWIKLHTNAARHRAAALKVLGPHQDKATLARAVNEWSATELESAIVEAGGCAAEMRSMAEWRAHPQGRAINDEPLLHWTRTPITGLPRWKPRAERPLEGIRVLDLTRVLAGPVAGRFLAGYGAEVLRIDPPDWDEPGVIPEVALGKRCARLDLTTAADRRTFAALLSQADILIHGYRPGALDGLDFGEAARRALAPGLIEVTLDAYGWTGPWRGRRGFDSLVQMSSGIAARGMEWKRAELPAPLPVQALDHATGYLMAAAAVRAITLKTSGGECGSIRASLARTAVLLGSAPQAVADEPIAAFSDGDFAEGIEHTSWARPIACARP